jgi:hypothetical protein
MRYGCALNSYAPFDLSGGAVFLNPLTLAFR